MKRTIILFSIVLLIVITGCANDSGSTMTTGQAISEIKMVACNKANEANTCFTKLPELGIISPEECCSEMKKCCGGK